LIGQTELRERLKRKPYKALRQRIGMQYHLGPLDREETEAYILHRLRVAGREAPLFDSGAIELLYRSSGGIPRRINIIAGNALIEGFGQEAQSIGSEIIENVVRDGE
jgi:type II secretory pathway predicted ATPase ExeA